MSPKITPPPCPRAPKITHLYVQTIYDRATLPKVIERKRKLFDKIRAKQHHGNNIGGGEGKGLVDENVGVSTTSGDTSEVCQDQQERVKSRDAGQQSPPVLKRLQTAKLVDWSESDNAETENNNHPVTVFKKFLFINHI